ncbi:hypothetical protein BC939DRAFT_114284 [Gamsiella multidivaricata]|uniref:uncharacterized protein n=1 Tax=Gamsiella multidivaricata TaxID=101098 RepID=UPI00221F7864|nr:uncharacterized protein BC939DRAFT_114284 [Gamsiella multidivaricata]KAG0370944.1 hypothetical protein BGZ54_002443 [Gamsiella multidivaricata]KAI7826608.1 hypothetical protein BC939DRAFT_114284 [Gamsiella multidivaricata]
METTKIEKTKKKFERKVAPSKAPRRLLKKKLRDLERLIQNKNKLKDLPEQVIGDVEKKIVEVKDQIEALGPESSPATAKKSSSSKEDETKTNSKGVRFTELRRAGRRITAFKKQHPNHESSEEESKELADLELDLLYIKNFPKREEYIPIYAESSEEDEERMKKQTEIRDKIAEALASGKIKRSKRPKTDDDTDEKAQTIIGKHPANNWSDDEDEEDREDEDSDDEREHKRQKAE